MLEHFSLHCTNSVAEMPFHWYLATMNYQIKINNQGFKQLILAFDK